MNALKSFLAGIVFTGLLGLVCSRFLPDTQVYNQSLVRESQRITSNALEDYRIIAANYVIMFDSLKLCKEKYNGRVN